MSDVLEFHALHRLVPVSERLPGYGGGALRRDLLAGVTVAALALPAAMAYGELAGLSAVAGLYALLLPTVAYTVFGSSRQLIVGPDGSISALASCRGSRPGTGAHALLGASAGPMPASTRTVRPSSKRIA